MPATSVSIHEAKASSVSRITYQISVAGLDGKPLAGADLAVTLDGDGSLSPSFSLKELPRATDDAGAARVTWYRRSIYNRDVNATLTAATERAGATVGLEVVPNEVAVASYDLPGQSKWMLTRS